MLGQCSYFYERTSNIECVHMYMCTSQVHLLKFTSYENDNCSFQVFFYGDLLNHCILTSGFAIKN